MRAKPSANENFSEILDGNPCLKHQESSARGNFSYIDKSNFHESIEISKKEMNDSSQSSCRMGLLNDSLSSIFNSRYKRIMAKSKNKLGTPKI